MVGIKEIKPDFSSMLIADGNAIGVTDDGLPFIILKKNNKSICMLILEPKDMDQVLYNLKLAVEVAKGLKK